MSESVFVIFFSRLSCYCSDFRNESNGIFVLGVGDNFSQSYGV